MAVTDFGTLTTQALKNRGVPMRVHALVKNEAGRWTRAFDAQDEPVTTIVWLQMSNDVLAAMEDPITGWGSMDAWQAALSATPYDALCRTIAIALDWWTIGDGHEVPDKTRAGKAMLDGARDDYSGAVGGAFMIANGLDPATAKNQMAAGVKSASAARAKQMALAVVEMDKAAAEADRELAEGEPDIQTHPSSGTPGGSGSLNGSEQVAVLTNSGG